MRSIRDNVSMPVASVVGPVFGATTTLSVTGSAIDTKGYNSGVLRVYTSIPNSIAGTANTLAVVVTESDTSSGSYTAANDNTGTQIGFIQTATTVAVMGSARIEGLGVNRKRYLKVAFTGGGDTKTYTAFAVVELGRAFVNPVDTSVSNT